MAPTFLVVPAANVNGAGEPTTLTGALIDTDTTLGGLANGTAYRAFVLSDPSPSFTPVVPPTLTGTPLGVSTVPSSTGVHTHTAPASLIAGRKYVIGLLLSNISGGTTTIPTVTVNGTAATPLGSASVADDDRRCQMFEVVPGATGTSVVIADTSQQRVTYLYYWEVPVGATYQRGLSTTATSGDTRALDVNTNLGELALAVAMSAGSPASALTWSGLTVEPGSDVTVAPGNRHTAARAENMAAATPRAITVTRPAVPGFEGFVASVVVYA